MRKKSLLILVVLLLLFTTCVACGKKTEQEQPAPSETKISVATAVQTEAIFELALDGVSYGQDAAEIRTSSISREALDKLPQMTGLKQVTVTEGDGENLKQLRTYCDENGIAFQVELAGQTITGETAELTLANVTENQVKLLSLMPDLQTLHFLEPEASAEALLALGESRTVTWEKTVLGLTFSNDAVEIDLSPVIALEEGQTLGDKTAYDYGCEQPIMSYPEDIRSSVLVTNEHPLPDKTDATTQLIAEVEMAMPYFPKAEKLLMVGAWLDNEAMAQFRENHRADYKVVWTVQCGMLATRTDAVRFMPTKFFVTQGSFTDWHTYNLRYCEDMVAMDLGHMSIVGLDFAGYMPQLTYLVITLSQVDDLSPLADCKNLVFLEMDWCDRVVDYSPLVECTALEDLNIGETFGDITPILEMTWLKNLWLVGGPEASYSRAKVAMPETNIAYYYGNPDDGWRELPNYYAMRDALLMFYMD